MRYFSLTETVLLSMLFSLREGGGLFILFYFILPFGLMSTFGNEKKYINKRSDSQLLVEAFNKKKLNLKTLLDVSMYVLIRAKLFY